MCGIAGWIGPMEDAPAVATRLGAALRHRGPDRLGQQIWNRAALVHTRLSIIDLSEAGAQPMCDEDATAWVAYNGEIYNHAAERSKPADTGSAADPIPRCCRTCIASLAPISSRG